MTKWTSACSGKQRNVNVFDLTAAGIGNSLAVGGFVVFGDLIKNVTGPAVLLSVALAGVAALFAGICFAELGVQFLKADSAYGFSYSFNKKHVAFVFGWALILQYVAGSASVGKGIVTFIDALAEKKISNFTKDAAATNFDSVFVYFDFVTFAVTVAVIIILAFGMKDSVAVKNIFTICNVVLIVFVLVAGSFKADPENWNANGSEGEKSKGGFMPFGILGVTKGAAIAFYGFVGFDSIGFPGIGNEVKSRKKNLPVAVITTIICLFLAYTGIGAILTLMLLYSELDEYAALPFAFESMSVTAKWVVAVATFFGFLTSLFGVSFPLPRIIQAMASDGLLFSFLSNNPVKVNVSKTAILFGGLLSGAATGIFSFQLLVSLTVLGALCVYTIIALNVLLTRYSRKDENETRSEPWTAYVSGSPGTHLNAKMKSCFSLKETVAVKGTERTIMGNIILYCLSSVGLSVTYSVFSDSLFKGSVEAVVSSCVFLCLLVLSLALLTRQSKLPTALPFEVPSVPFLPCLSIFLNIFLMTTLDSITWIIFSSWMVLGISVHLLCQCFNTCAGNPGKSSLYEINKSNALKLNEAIWKINSEKRSFYEGAINPVFIDDSENTSEEVKTTPVNEINVHNEKAILQLKQAEIIQTAEMVMEEKAEPLQSELESELGFDRNSLDKNNSVRWECVAEIHTEEEFPQESIVLEIVDNTYNFLSEVSEESPKDNVSQKSDGKQRSSIGSEKEAELDESKDTDIQEECAQPKQTNLIGDTEKFGDFQNFYKNLGFQNELFTKVSCRRKATEKNLGEKEGGKEKISQDSGGCQNDDEFVSFVIETFYEAPKGDMIPRTRRNLLRDGDAEKESKVPEELNKIKEFKEKLNQLLKNQINSGGNMEKGFTVLKSDSDDAEMNKKSEPALFENIKTLNKTQIRGKLEVLLAKGPPKRPSFKNQFRNNVKDGQTEKTKSDDEVNTITGEHPPNNSDIKMNATEVETLSSTD